MALAIAATIHLVYRVLGHPLSTLALGKSTSLGQLACFEKLIFVTVKTLLSSWVDSVDFAFPGYFSATAAALEPREWAADLKMRVFFGSVDVSKCRHEKIFDAMQIDVEGHCGTHVQSEVPASLCCGLSFARQELNRKRAKRVWCFCSLQKYISKLLQSLSVHESNTFDTFAVALYFQEILVLVPCKFGVCVFEVSVLSALPEDLRRNSGWELEIQLDGLRSFRRFFLVFLGFFRLFLETFSDFCFCAKIGLL